MITLLLSLVIPLVFFAIYITSKRKYEHWEKKKIPHLKPVPILGNFSEYILQKTYLGQVAQKICKKFPNEPFIGAYYGTEPALIVQDPELIKIVMTKDFYFFSGREVSNYSHKEMFTQNLFFTYGDRWKVLRQNLTPLFSSAKMKNMFHLIEKCSRVFEKVLDKETQKCDEIEVRALMAGFTMDCIGSCAFGVDTNVMEKTENNIFRKIADLIFDIQGFRAFKNVARAIWPSVFYGLGFRAFPREIDNFFNNLMSGIFKGREYKPTNRNDFVDLVLKLSNNKTMTGDSLLNMKSDADKKVVLEVDEEMLVAQCVLFFAAGFETSSTTLSYALYELAKNPEAQEKALAEVDEYLRRHDNTLKYECVAGTPYLEACVDEALRLYPVLGLLTREVAEDYTFPSGLEVEKGLRVHLPVYHLHHHPEHFPDPEQFRPERFLAENKQNIKPYTYMPFGEGPRICIGMRFARMQMAAGLLTLLKKYRVELAPGMKRELVFEPGAIVTQPIGGIKLKFVERENWKERLLKTP
uniref:unspecific monooxygenase n=1 Tax=Helicoverpa armigera TaxID=29058 RepID=Q2XSW1_HELAM|nr:cytochrome P450 [Helicoverpa armigera]